jgi:cytochrome oxidase Cu insertion factor (SCO1/SenC/PrrC family)
VSSIRKPSTRALLLTMAASFIVVAIAAGVAAAPSDTATTADASTADASTADAWKDIELTNAQTGETFTIAGLAGNVVAIEPMAIWCTQCKVQNENFKKAFSDLEAAGVQVISLGVEPNQQPEALAEYAERRGYEWTFALSPKELSRALADQFTAQVLSVPATPLIVLSPDGEVAFQDFGFHGPDSLIEIVTAAALPPSEDAA